MKRLAAVITAVVIVAAWAYPAHAAQSYTNAQFKYSCTYPDGWKMKEETPETGVNVGEAAFGVKIGKSVDVGIPAMSMACFGKKKCSPGDMGADPQMHLIMMEMPKVKKGKAAPEQKAKAEKGSDKKETDCEVIAKGSKKWAGAKAPYTTTRCEEKKKWRYNTVVTMMRNRGGKNYTYTLDCTMRSKSKDKGESMTEFNRDLKPHCDESISSAKFAK